MNEDEWPLEGRPNTNSDVFTNNINAAKIYIGFHSIFDFFTNWDTTSIAIKTTLNFSISNFFEIDMGGVV